MLQNLMISAASGDIIQDMPKRAIETAPLHDRIATILNTEQRAWNVTEVLQALKEAGDPDVSRAAVNQALSKSFYRAARGRYRISQEANEGEEDAVDETEEEETPTESPVVARPEPSNGNNGHSSPRRRRTSVGLELPPDIADNVELRNLITAYGTLAVRALLDEIEQQK